MYIVQPEEVLEKSVLIVTHLGVSHKPFDFADVSLFVTVKNLFASWYLLRVCICTHASGQGALIVSFTLRTTRLHDTSCQ